MWLGPEAAPRASPATRQRPPVRHRLEASSLEVLRSANGTGLEGTGRWTSVSWNDALVDVTPRRLHRHEPQRRWRRPSRAVAAAAAAATAAATTAAAHRGGPLLAGLDVKAYEDERGTKTWWFDFKRPIFHSVAAPQHWHPLQRATDRQLELEVDAEQLQVAPEQLEVAPEQLEVAPEQLEVAPEQLQVAPEQLQVAQGTTAGHKLDLSWGPCQLQVNEPCTDNGSIIFYLFRTVDGRPAVLSVTDPQLPEIYDPELPTKVLIHGFAGSVEFNFTASIRQAYLLRGGYNVLVVDWGRLTQLPCYASSVINTWQVSRCAGQLLSQLGRREPSLAPRHLHLVGFSLGAHIAGYLSAELHASTGQRVGRITGLDPALPAFASLSPSWKLDQGDAEFVDVVHTNAGVLGKVEPTGHADFYINGGSVQPFCTGGDRNIPLCSHLLAPVYFAETILDEQSHWGRHCTSYGHYAWGWCPREQANPMGTFMGEGALADVHGTFIVETNPQFPFAAGPPLPIPPLPPPAAAPDTFLVVLSRQTP